MFDYFDDQFRLQMDEAGYTLTWMGGLNGRLACPRISCGVDATGTNSVHVQTGCGSHQFLSRIDAERNLSLTSSWNSSVSIGLGVIVNLVAENTAKSLSSPVIGGRSGGGSLAQYCRGQRLIEVGKFDFNHDYTQAGGTVANVTSICQIGLTRECAAFWALLQVTRRPSNLTTKMRLATK
ncbi:hypothetical protein F5876DRAFT_70099 [Lentinula aff. lateritia]|uniref:Uncharacterized protein n=1 Tax=Lentinula aff. lateritia TaxID=2804960 RepID=A0ACC1TK45_9AGAR|nr:hypothetical protein F5876DRAFT_70099 [Lentinula aff. lateritia]